MAGIRRQYLIHPQLAGAYAVPPVVVEVVYARPNARPSEPFTLVGPELRFEARVPPEAAGLGYFIAARGLALHPDVQPKPDGLRVGDALTRTITLIAADSSSMMLPITEFPTIDGLAVYPEPSRASDRGGERGSAREAMRVDSATYVLETEGDFTLPEVRISWWDLTAGRLRTASAPAVELEVAPNPDLAAEIALPEEPDEAEAAPVPDETSDWREWLPGVLVGLGVAMALGGVSQRYGPTLRARLAEARRRRRDSEEAHFARVLAACRRNDASATMRTLLAWVDRITPAGESPTLRRLVGLAADPDLAEAVAALEHALYGSGAAEAWRGSRVAESLERARRSRRVGAAPSRVEALAPLNPTA